MYIYIDKNNLYDESSPSLINKQDIHEKGKKVIKTSTNSHLEPKFHLQTPIHTPKGARLFMQCKNKAKRDKAEVISFLIFFSHKVVGVT